MAEARIDTKCEFQKERGALLLMHEAQVSFIPDPAVGLLVGLPLLEGKSIVTRVWNCPRFVRYLSDEGGDAISVKLVANVPIAAAAGLSVGGGVGMHWTSEHGAGSYKEACDPKGAFVYSTLFELKQARKKLLWRQLLRDGGPTTHVEEKGVDMLEDAELPWGELDENGDDEEEEL